MRPKNCLLVSYKPLAAHYNPRDRRYKCGLLPAFLHNSQRNTVYFHTEEPRCPTRAARQLNEMTMRPKAWCLLSCIAAVESGGYAMTNSNIRTAVAAWLADAAAAEATYGHISTWDWGGD